MNRSRVALLLIALNFVLFISTTAVSKDQDRFPSTERQEAGAADIRHHLGPIGTPIGSPLELEGNPGLAGIAFDDKRRELLVLDDIDNDIDKDSRSETGERIMIYSYDPTSATLVLKSSFIVPNTAARIYAVFRDGRGLAVTNERDRRILYTLSSRPDGTRDREGNENFISFLWRIDFTQPASVTAQNINLDKYAFDLRGAEVFDLGCDKNGHVYISFDASKQAVDLNDQRSRGILRFRIKDEFQDNGSDFDKEVKSTPKILPASGKSPSHHCLGLTVLEKDGYEYLVGTIEERSNNENQEIYVADRETGRGLFKFDAPPAKDVMKTGRHLAFGAGVLWVGEQQEDSSRVQPVVIIDNIYEPVIGYKRPRRIQITITSEALGSAEGDHGFIIHNFGHPLGSDIKPSQGDYFEGHSLMFECPAYGASGNAKPPECSIRSFSYLPMNDPSSLGCVTQVKYLTSSAGPGIYKTVFQEDFWIRQYRHFVYPHLANNSLGILKNTDFEFGHLKNGDPAIKDSLPRFHWTSQQRIFEDFINRAKLYIAEKYGVEGDFENPYWAARNIQEYIRDNYNYPDPVASEDGSGDSRGNVVDPDHFHMANGPAVYKMIMTDPRFNDDIRKRRTGCMAAGGIFLAVMRYMGFPARWMGTSQQMAPATDDPRSTGIFYDLDGDGMFNGNDYMDASHGHYTNEVYLGPGYGWQRFDVSPRKPDDQESDGLDYEDFAYLHSRDSQYGLMSDKVASGHQSHAVASSVGVGYNEHFFMNDGENSPDCDQSSIYHETTGVYTSACKGAQSYDFVSIYEHPKKVITRYDQDARMRWRPCLTFDVELREGNPVIGKYLVEFRPRGPWRIFEPDARVEIVLRIEDNGLITHQILKTDVAWDQGRETVIIPEGASGKSCRIQVRKIGVEGFIGGASSTFIL